MRLRKLTPSELTTDQRELYDQIASGPRARGTQHFPLVEESGALAGPFGLMLHDPALGRPLQELGSALRYRSGLSDRLREIAILAVAAATGSEFERYAHERVGRAAGLTEEELTDLAARRFTSADAVEAAGYLFCRRLLDERSDLTDVEYAELHEALCEITLIELVVLVGYYRTLAQLLNVFDIGAP
jgi:4-carboxymuconolactone decarboxylase